MVFQPMAVVPPYKPDVYKRQIMQLSIAVSIAAASLLLDRFGGHSATSGKAVETAFHTTFRCV